MRDGGERKTETERQKKRRHRERDRLRDAHIIMKKQILKENLTMIV